MAEAERFSELQAKQSRGLREASEAATELFAIARDLGREKVERSDALRLLAKSPTEEVLAYCAENISLKLPVGATDEDSPEMEFPCAWVLRKAQWRAVPKIVAWAKAGDRRPEDQERAAAILSRVMRAAAARALLMAIAADAAYPTERQRLAALAGHLPQ